MVDRFLLFFGKFFGYTYEKGVEKMNQIDEQMVNISNYLCTVANRLSVEDIDTFVSLIKKGLSEIEDIKRTKQRS
jgi:hypothetical protein